MTKVKKSHDTGFQVFIHGGIDIHVTVDGEFAATLDGKRVTKPSLAAMKKHIDKRRPVVSFDALDVEGKPIKVIGIRKKSGKRFSKDRWILEGLTFDESVVYADTLANRKAIAAYNAHNEKTDKLMDECNRKSSQLLAKIKSITPDERAGK